MHTRYNQFCFVRAQPGKPLFCESKVNDNQQKDESSFYVSETLDGTDGYSLESVAYPDYYINHKNNALLISKY